MSDKAPEAFRTIGEVADQLRTPAHVLRFWESKFSQIKPVKRAGGRRYYRPADVALLAGIKQLLHDDGMTIRGVQKLLREQGARHVAALAAGGAPAPLSRVQNGAASGMSAEPAEAATVPPQPQEAPADDAPARPDPVAAEVAADAGPETDPVPEAAADAAVEAPFPPETLFHGLATAPPSEPTAEPPPAEEKPVDASPQPARTGEPDTPAAAEAPPDGDAPAPVQVVWKADAPAGVGDRPVARLRGLSGVDAMRAAALLRRCERLRTHLRAVTGAGA